MAKVIAKGSIFDGYLYTPLAKINHNADANSIDYYSIEVNGQPLELTDSNGTIQWSATYNNWGKLLRLNQINDREGRVFGIDQPHDMLINMQTMTNLSGTNLSNPKD